MKQLRKLFLEDQSERKNVFSKNNPSEKALKQLEKNDAKRRKEVLRLFRDGEIKTKYDFYYAAMIFQHGGTKNQFKKANEFAEKSMNMEYEKAKWLYAATLDRYLKSQGKPQKFGTQFHNPKGKKWQMYKYDKKTTDAERKKYNVDSFKDLLKFGDELNEEDE